MSPVIIIHLAGDANINLPPLVLDKRDHVVLPPPPRSFCAFKSSQQKGRGMEKKEENQRERNLELRTQILYKPYKIGPIMLV